MPRDYKHRAQKKPSKKPLPGWLWLLTGLLLGGFAMGLAWLKGQSSEPGGEWLGAEPDRAPQGLQPPVRAVETPPRPKPRFDFYDMLPKQTVPLPEHELEPKRERKAVEDRNARYLLQVGSFRKPADAERLKAQLAFLGFEAQVVSAKIGTQDVRHRVRTGPFVGTKAVDAARKRLAGNGFEGIVIRLGAN